MINNYKEYLDAVRKHNKSEDILKFERKHIQNRIGDWMTTFHGGIFWLLDPKPEEVDIRDIAHALSLICRYNGHIKSFYSVAQHSVLVSENCPTQYSLYGLLHDAAEAYTGDIISPLKRLLPNYKVIEEKILNAVCKKFQLRVSPKCKQEVKVWDNVLLSTEVRDLIPHKYLNWKLEQPPLNKVIDKFWSPKVAESKFLKRFNYLYGKRKNG